MGCFFFSSGSAKAGKKQGSSGRPGDASSVIVGPASCRRMSLEPYGSPGSGGGAPSRASAGASSHGKQPPSGAGRAGATIQLSAATPGSAGTGGMHHASSSPTLHSDNYIEVNPLRRLSMPTAGQVPRPPGTELRRGSLPQAAVQLPREAAVAARG